MFNFTNYTGKIEEEYRLELDERKKELKALPKGSLTSRKKGGKTYYVHQIGKKEIGITNNPPMIQALARKRYLKEYLRRMELNLKQIQNCHKNCLSLDPQHIIKSLADTYKDLNITIFFPKQDDAWGKIPYKTNTKNRNHRVIATNGGVMVRSKSEQIIGNALEARGLSYCYEKQIILSGKAKYPDFTIQNARTGKIIIWEHFGLVGNKDYERDMKKKMQLYQVNGWVPLKNLIYTFEEDVKDSRRINQIIDIILL